MYNNAYKYPYYDNYPWYNPAFMNSYSRYPYPVYTPVGNPHVTYDYADIYAPLIREMDNTISFARRNRMLDLKDYGPNPFVIDIDDAAEQNENFRTALWTGDNIQLTLMSIPIGQEIGLEMHPDTDQFIRIEDGRGMVQMGKERDNLDFTENVDDDYIIIIPAGIWHNLINTGNEPIKLYSIYAPPEHPRGTVQETKEIADREGH